MIDFELQKTDSASAARAGKITTAHGDILTPIFMPVGTAGTVKGVHIHELKEIIHAQIILGNTYHLYLRPGMDVINEAGGLHSFMKWDRPILTDSGGYQVYSLGQNRKIKEEGVTFQSHIDGSKLLFSPERVMAIQRTIGADITMAFDECTPYPCSYDYAEKSMQLTHRWLKRCQEVALHPYQSLFPIVQGSTFPELRKISANTIAETNLRGNAIGGLSVGEPAEEMYDMTALVTEILPKEKPRYLMGVGTPVNILECIALGIDMFDCVLPSRNARHGLLYTSKGIINIKNAKWQNDHTPIDEDAPSPHSVIHSKAYLRHLIISGEMLGLQIATLHNLSFYLWLITEARKQILLGNFHYWKNKMVAELQRRL
jgi:queuine tRNA-ribosyltransferase